MNFASRLLQPRWRSAWTRFSRSGRCTPLLVGILCVFLVGATLEFGHGHLHVLTEKINPPVAGPPPSSGPGGQDVLRLSRAATSNGEEPEFLSVTLLPGRGMNMFQLVARIPGQGDVALLASPPLAEGASALNGQANDSGGADQTTPGAFLMLPWARRLTGTSVAAPGGGDALVQAEWQGQTLRVPSDPPGSNTSVEGLLQQLASDSLQTEVLRDGQSAQAVYHPASVAGQWPSSLEVTVQVELEAQELDLTMTTKNTGTQPMPLGAGWQPAFALPTGSRSRVMLAIPSTTVTEVDPATARPTGRTLSVAHTPLDFSSPGGTILGNGAINQTYTDLQAAPTGTVADLCDPSIDLLLRLVALTPNTSSLHVVAPSDRAWVSISPNTNLDDPLGPEWTQHPSGLVTLAPGETTQWKVRLQMARLSTLGEPK